MRFQTEQAFALVLSFAKLKSHPLGHVPDVRVDGSGRTDQVQIAHGQSFVLLLVFIPEVALGQPLVFLRDRNRGGGIRHVQRIQNPSGNKRFPVTVRCLARSLSSGHVHDIVV